MADQYAAMYENYTYMCAQKEHGSKYNWAWLIKKPQVQQHASLHFHIVTHGSQININGSNTAIDFLKSNIDL